MKPTIRYSSQKGIIVLNDNKEQLLRKKLKSVTTLELPYGKYEINEVNYLKKRIVY